MVSVNTPSLVGDDDIFHRLREAIQSAISSGVNAQSIKDISQRLLNMEIAYRVLTPSEQNQFIQQMGNSFENVIASIQNKLQIYEEKRQRMLYSFILLAVVCLIFALFGYKLYKSLMEKEQKKQEKQKNTKKSKKAKQK